MAAENDTVKRIPVGLLLLLAAAGCGGTQRAAIPYDAQLTVRAAAPPSPATWNDYPLVFPHSCWTRPGNGVMRFAPTVLAGPRERPARIAAQVLAGLDRDAIRSIALDSVPHRAIVHRKGYFANALPPGDALWADVVAPAAGYPLAHPTPAQVQRESRAEWEVGLATGALRDRLCTARGRPLAGWDLDGHLQGISDGGQALAQRFPNPAPDRFRALVARAARRYGFRVVSLRLLRPLQLAPDLVVRTDRDRSAFVRDLPALVSLLDPRTSAHAQTAMTFEGFRLVAEDVRGRPFASVESAYRGQAMGGQWSANPCVYPYPHGEPALQKPHCGWPR
jgi:hypothetical protein